MIIVKGKLTEILYHACLIDGKLDSVIAADEATILLSPKELAEQMTAGNFKEFIKHIHKIPLPQPQKQTFTDSDFLLKKPQQECTCDHYLKVVNKDCPVHPPQQDEPKCGICNRYIHNCKCKPQQEFCECKEPKRTPNKSDSEYGMYCICGKPLRPEPKPELASEVDLAHLIMANSYLDTEEADMLAHVLVGKIGKIEPKPYKINDQIVSKEVFEKFSKECGFEPKKEIEELPYHQAGKIMFREMIIDKLNEVIRYINKEK